MSGRPARWRHGTPPDTRARDAPVDYLVSLVVVSGNDAGHDLLDAEQAPTRFRGKVRATGKRVTLRSEKHGQGPAAPAAEVMPEDKARIVHQRQAHGQVIAMVGDGINDAPALAQADVGMAMGVGTDIAIESADVVLLGTHLGTIPAAIDVGQQTYAKIRQNLLWAFCFNAVGIPIAASGWLHPTMAIAAMVSSTLGILLNSFGLRLSRLATFSLPTLEMAHATTRPAVENEPA